MTPVGAVVYCSGMLTLATGGASAGLTDPPTSEVSLATQRRRLRNRLRPKMRRLQHLALLAAQAVEGPDPEAALVFLSMLRRRCVEALSK